MARYTKPQLAGSLYNVMNQVTRTLDAKPNLKGSWWYFDGQFWYRRKHG